MYDLIIKNGLIVDGTGDAPFHGDIAIKDGIIYDAKELLKDVELMVEKQKQERGELKQLKWR